MVGQSVPMSLIGILAVGFNPIRLEAQGDAIGEQSPGTVTLQDISAGRARLVDLTHTLTPENAFWPGEKYRPFQLVTIAALKDDGVLSKAFAMPEHLGMHIDAPNHFERDHVSVDRIPPSRLVSPGVLVDILAKCEQNADYELTVEDVAAWETQHGRIPDGAIVLLRTGWARYWNNVTRYQGRDVRGLLHFPPHFWWNGVTSVVSESTHSALIAEYRRISPSTIS